jgi:PGF-CTERM protein
MKQARAVALVVLVVGGGLVAVVPASALGGSALESPEKHNASEIDARTPPELPEQWQQTYGGSGDDMVSDLVRTDDGGYLLVGWSETETGLDGWIVKTDGEGEQEWSKTLGGEGTDRFWGVTRAGEGYLLAGRTDDGGAKGWVVELNPSGDVREQRTLGSGAFYAVESRESETGTEHLLAGWTRGDGGTEGWTTELSGNLSVAWQTSYRTPDGYDDGYLRAVVPTDSGYYLAGKIEGDSDDAWALRIGNDGSQAWQTTAGGPSRDDVWAAASGSTEANASAGFVLAGETESDSTGPRDGWLVKFGPEGATEWEQRPGGEGTQWLDSAMRTDEGYLFTGSSDAGPTDSVDGYVLATDEAGETSWEKYYGTDGWDKPWPAIRAHGSNEDTAGYVLAGQTGGGDSQGKDGWFVKIGEAESGPGTTASGDVTTDSDTTDESTTSDDDATSDEAIQGETATATDGPEGDIPGFGVGVALLAFAAALLALRR